MTFSFPFVLDIDECKLGTHNCDKKAECQNTEGKYICKCQVGYQGNGQTCQGVSRLFIANSLFATVVITIIILQTL